MITYNQTAAQTRLAEIASDYVNRPVVDATLAIREGRAMTTASQVGRSVDLSATLGVLRNEILRLSTASTIHLVISETAPVVWDTTEVAAQIDQALAAPVPVEVLARMRACIHPEGEMHTPYGATESLPVASIGAGEVLGETAAATRRGAGVCVGRRFSRIQWKVIRITDGPIASIDQAEDMPQGEIGELIVRGPAVTPPAEPAATAQSPGPRTGP